MFEPLFYNLWFILIIWAIVYSSDYYLTVYSAHLYHTHLKNYIIFEGSFELTPYFQQDIDALRRVSPNFIRALVLSLILIGWIWFLTLKLFNVPGVYAFALGGLLLREAVVHLRHSRNLSLSLLSRAGGGLSGKVDYARPLILRVSALELLSFAGLFLVIFLAWSSWFFLGGAVFCLFSGVQHWRMAAK